MNILCGSKEDGQCIDLGETILDPGLPCAPDLPAMHRVGALCDQSG
jgi:hypothetical protein